MFKSNNKNFIPNMNTIINKSETPSILAKSFQLEGDILSSGILEIEGKIKGSVKGNIVVIRESGLIEGKIEAESLNIYGSFKGEVHASSISIFKKAKIIGNIEYKSLSIEDGACIDGQFKRINSSTSSIANDVVSNSKNTDLKAKK